MKEKIILNDKEVALILDVSLFTVKKLAKNEDIPCFYKNRRPYFYFDMVISHFQKIEGGRE